MAACSGAQQAAASASAAGSNSVASSGPGRGCGDECCMADSVAGEAACVATRGTTQRRQNADAAPVGAAGGLAENPGMAAFPTASLCSIAACVLLAACLRSPAAAATMRVYRCVDGSGAVAWQDRPCAAGQLQQQRRLQRPAREERA